MSHENPTPLRVGATGTLNGWRVRVAGRIVLGVEVEGETYTWNEFHLVDDSGNAATLVFEEGEAGPEWKIFREFTPAQPMTAREAAAKKVGDDVNLDGSPVMVTLVDQSEVLWIEGRAPEGVEVGDVANYFNADTGSRMLVASWSGNEIEFYEGLDAPAESVAAAFGFPAVVQAPEDRSAGFASRRGDTPAQSFRSEPGSTGSSGLFTKIAFALLSAAGLFGTYSCFSSGGKPSLPMGTPAVRITAPAARLASGARGQIAALSYTVGEQKIVALARTTGRRDCREYQVREESGVPALLINGLSGGAEEWHLLRSTPIPKELTPHAAATKRKGDKVTLDGRAVTVTDLFRATPAASEANPTAVKYGFVARDSDRWILARWSEAQIEIFSGLLVTDAAVSAAFGPAGAKTK